MTSVFYQIHWGGCITPICVPDFVPQNVDVIGALKKPIDEIPKTDFSRNSGLRDLGEGATKIVNDTGAKLREGLEGSIGKGLTALGQGINEITGKNEEERKREQARRQRVKEIRFDIENLESDISRLTSEKSYLQGKIDGTDSDSVEISEIRASLPQIRQLIELIEKLGLVSLANYKNGMEILTSSIKRKLSLQKNNFQEWLKILEDISNEIKDPEVRNIHLQIVDLLKKSDFDESFNIVIDYYDKLVLGYYKFYLLDSTFLSKWIRLVDEYVTKQEAIGQSKIRFVDLCNQRINYIDIDLKNKVQQKKDRIGELNRNWW